MKKNIYIVLFGLLLSMGVASCDNDTDLLFDESAAERKEGANKEYNDALKSSEQGWLFQYYPEETQKYGGYNFVVKFAEDDQVTVWSENMADFTQPETSTYNIISYGGPVLTFDTYNSIMHEFATPSAAEYLAKGGDYEFLIMSNEDDVITVKGIKTGNDLILTKMTEDPEVYLQKIKDVSKLFKGSSFESTIKETPIEISVNAHRLTFNYSENGEIKSEKAAFIPMPTGISFYEPLTILGITVESLTLNIETNQLISEDGQIVIDIIQAPVDLTSAIWGIDTSVESDCCSALKAAWDKAYTDNSNAYGEVLYKHVFLGQSIAGGGNIGFSMVSLYSGGNWKAHYNLDFRGVLGHPTYLNIVKGSEGLNWSYYTYLSPILDLIANNAPYTIETDDDNDPKVVKLTSVGNPDIWFTLRR